MKNRKQQYENDVVEDLEIKEIPPKQGLSGKKHCICIDCDIFGCDENCYVCTKDFEEY